MPIIGQPAHTHFTPIVEAVELDRISLSVTYLYNVTQSTFRITLTRTYIYDIKVIVSRSQTYLYNLNPTILTGPTRLYFHNALNPLPNLPDMCLCVLTPNKSVDAQTVNRTMNSIISATPQSSKALQTNATTASQVYYFTKFVTETLTQINTISANTWTYNFAAKTGGGATANFTTSGANQPVRAVAYVWRPSTFSKVGDIIDANTASTVDESTANERVCHTTFSGNQVLGVQDGDVIVFEVLFVIAQASAVAPFDTFYYDGTTINTVKNTTVTSHASFLETPQGLLFGAPLTRVSKSSIRKYDIIGRVSSSRAYRYDIKALASLSRLYRYAVTQPVLLTRSYLYTLTGRLSVPSINKYNILVRKTAPKIFRYALQSTLQSFKTYKYDIYNTVPTLSRIYRYNIGNVASLSQVYKYSIYKAVLLARIYKYSLIARLAQAEVIKYNIANRITSAKIYRYTLAVKLSFSRLYKYNLLTAVSSSSHIRYSILSKLSTSKIFRYTIAIRVTLSRLYKYNLTSFSQVSLSTIYKYNLVSRRSLSRIYNYNIANRLSSSRAYKYNLTVRATLSRIYRYAILNPVTLSRTYKYNLLVRLASIPKTYKYNLLARLQKSQSYLYNLAKTISLSRIYRYRLGAGISLEQTYLYNFNARVSLALHYRYSIAIISTGVLWQLTGKNSDFPDSLENLVRDFIKENWSIIDPVLSTTPIVTSALSRQHQSQVDNFAYDTYRSYYIRVKEIGSEVKNRQVRLNTYEFSTPIDIETYARRLKKGEAYPQLNAMINELLRIFGTYQEDGIFGVQGITLDRISSMEKERPPAQNIWARRLRIILHYYKVSVVG